MPCLPFASAAHLPGASTRRPSVTTGFPPRGPTMRSASTMRRARSSPRGHLLAAPVRGSRAGRRSEARVSSMRTTPAHPNGLEGLGFALDRDVTIESSRNRCRTRCGLVPVEHVALNCDRHATPALADLARDARGAFFAEIEHCDRLTEAAEPVRARLPEAGAARAGDDRLPPGELHQLGHALRLDVRRQPLRADLLQQVASHDRLRLIHRL